MAFKNEDIPDDLRKKFNIESHKTKWTADYENNCFLLGKGTNREAVISFNLYYKNYLVEIRAINNYKGHPDTTIFINYLVDVIYMHLLPIEQQVNIEQTLFESLKEYCLTGRCIPNSELRVDFRKTHWKKDLFTKIEE